MNGRMTTFEEVNEAKCRKKKMIDKNSSQYVIFLAFF